MKLNVDDEVGAEPTKDDAAEVSALRLLMELDVCVKEIDVISSRIQKLRDEELQPKTIALIRGYAYLFPHT